MPRDPMSKVRNQVTRRIAQIRAAADQLSPLDLYARMDAIRELAAANGLDALEGLARHSAQMALLPGHRIRLSSALEHVDEALESHSTSDRTAILAALAIRLH